MDRRQALNEIVTREEVLNHYPLRKDLAIAGNIILVHHGHAIHRQPDMLAFALIALLLIGLRNSWDMTLWILDRRLRNNPDQ
jgi:hypothetical protein